jgi:hypothetical protein
MNWLLNWTDILLDGPPTPAGQRLIQRLILLAFAGCVAWLAVRRLRSYRLKERYTLLFLFMGLPILLLAVWPRGIGILGEILHIQYTTVAMLIAAALGILMVLEFLTIVSLQDRKIAALAQIVGILMEKHGMSGHSAAPGPGSTPPLDPDPATQDVTGKTTFDPGPQNRE